MSEVPLYFILLSIGHEHNVLSSLVVIIVSPPDWYQQTTLPTYLHLVWYRGTSLIRNSPPPQDHHRALGTYYCRVLGGTVSYERGTPVLHFGFDRS